MISSVSRNIATKFANTGAARKLSTQVESDLTKWIRINDKLHTDAAAKAEQVVSSVKSEVASLRSEVRTDVSNLSKEITNLKGTVDKIQDGQNKLNTQISRLHGHVTRNTQMILGGVGTILVILKGLDYFLPSLSHNNGIKNEESNPTGFEYKHK